MDLLTLLAFTVAYLVAVLVPGPGVAAIVARARDRYKNFLLFFCRAR